MSKIDLGRIDLNLLVTFEVLMREMNVTRAAEELGRTQSAISHSLGRLREQLGDPLLVRVGGRMTPTPYALKLKDDILPILRSLQHVISPPAAFDPASSDRTFRIAFPDYGRSFLSSVFARVQQEAPGVAVEWMRPQPDILPLVAGGQVDVCEIAGRSPLLEGIESHQGEPYIYMSYMRREHPAALKWGAEAWVTWPHLRVFVDDKNVSPVDDSMRQDGLRRRIGAYVPNFSSVGPILARTDFIATLPPVVMVDVLDEFDLVALKPPVAIEPMPTRFLWSARMTNDPGNRWFRNLVIETYSDLHRQAQQSLTARWLARAADVTKAT